VVIGGGRGGGVGEWPGGCCGVVCFQLAWGDRWFEWFSLHLVGGEEKREEGWGGTIERGKRRVLHGGRGGGGGEEQKETGSTD